MKKAIANINELYPKLAEIENNFQKMIKVKDAGNLLITWKNSRFTAPRELFFSLFEKHPNLTRIEKVNFDNCLNWLLTNYQSEIVGYTFDKSENDIFEIDFPILSISNFCLLLKNEILVYLEVYKRSCTIYFTEESKKDALEIENKCTEFFYINEIAETEMKIKGFQLKLKYLLEN